MKREEAIKTLHELCRETNDPWYEEVYNLAIEALTQPIVVKCHEIEKDYIYCSPETAEKVCNALHLYHNSNVHNLHSGDLINRKEVIRELCEMMVDCFNADEEVIDAIKTTVEEIPSANMRGEKE